MIVEFPTLAAALAFLQRESPAEPDEAWALLGRVTLLRRASGHSVAVGCEQGVFSDDVAGRALRCGGRVLAEADGNGTWKEKLSFRELFRRVNLEPSNRTEQGRRFLIVPDGSESASHSVLVEWLSEVENCSCWVRDVRPPDAKETLTVFELRAESQLPVAAPAGLPGAPQVLVAIDDDVFVPAGLTCPLLPAYRFLFPPSTDGRLHAWLTGPKGLPGHVQLIDAGAAAVPLARVVVLPADIAKGPTVSGGSARVKLPLRLRPVNAKRRLQRASQVLYVVESRGAELGAALLRLFDHCEAGIEQFMYYSRASSDGPNAVVEHFLLADSRIADDDMWPELRRFDLPRSLADVGLRLFIPADADFSPDLQGVVNGLDVGDEFLRVLREAVGLTEAPPDRLALVEPSAREAAWRITTLEKGQPLKSLVSVVLESWNREPVRRVINVQRADLSEDHRRYEEQWLSVGAREAAEFADLTRALAERLGEAVAQAEAQLTQLADRIGALTEVAGRGQELVTAAPSQFSAFVDGAIAIVDSVAAPRREWLQNAEARRRAMESLATATRDLQRNVQAEIERAGADVQRVGGEIATAGQRLAEGRSAVEGALQTLDRQAAAAMSAARDAQVAIGGRERRVRQAEAEVTARERELSARAAEVDRFQETVQAQEHRVERQRRALEQRQVELEARLAEATQAAGQARAEEQRLRDVEANEIPAAQRRRQEAEADVARLRGRRLDERLRDTQTQVAALELESRNLRHDQERLDALASDLGRLKSEVSGLRERVTALRARGLEASVEAASAESAMLSADATSLEAVVEAVRAASASISSARRALGAVNRARGVEELASRIAELSAVAKALDEERRRAANGQLPSEAASRLEQAERTLQELRGVSDPPARGWLGRWFGGRR